MSFALLQLRRGNGSTQVGGCVLEGSRCARLVQAGLSRLDYVRMEWIYYGFCRRCFVARAGEWTQTSVNLNRHAELLLRLAHPCMRLFSKNLATANPYDAKNEN